MSLFLCSVLDSSLQKASSSSVDEAQHGSRRRSRCLAYVTFNPITVNVTRESHIPVRWRELRCDSEFAASNNRPWYGCGLQYFFLSQQEGDAQEPRRLNGKYVTHHEQSLDSFSKAPRRCRKLSSRHAQHGKIRKTHVTCAGLFTHLMCHPSSDWTSCPNISFKQHLTYSVPVPTTTFFIQQL